MNCHRRLITLALVLMSAGSTVAWGAETVTRRGDKPLAGDVTAVSRIEVTVKVRAPKEDTIQVPANEVLGISWTGESPEANLARGDDAGGRYQRAMDGYQKALQAGKSSNPLAKVELEYGITRATARLALNDPDRLDDAIKRLEDFRKSHGDHYRFYEALGLLGQLHLAKKDFVKAQLAFDALARAPWKETQMAARVATGRLLQADGKPDEALAAFDAVIAESADSASEAAQRQAAQLGKTRVLLGQKKYTDAQTLLEEVIRLAGPDETRLYAEAYVRLGDCLREQGKDDDALIAYLHVDVLFTAEKALHAEALFHLTRLWDKLGNKARAAEARDKLESDEFRNSEWAQQLKAPAAG